MKRKIGFLVCLILVLFCTAALAADIKINEKNFPDPVFRDYVKQYCRGWQRRQSDVHNQSEIALTSLTVNA